LGTRTRFLGVSLLLGAILLAGCAGEMAQLPWPGSKQPEPSPKQPEPVLEASRQFVQAHALNFRECPGAKCRIIGVLLRGREVSVQQQKEGWAEVTPQGDTRRGWVAARYLGPEKPASPARLAAPGQKPAQEPPAPKEEFAPTNAPLPKVKEEFVK